MDSIAEVNTAVDDNSLISVELKQSIIDIVGQDDFNLLMNYYIAREDPKVIAENYGISESTLRKRIQRIKELLKNNL